MLYQELIELSLNKGYLPSVLQYKNKTIVVHRESTERVLTLGFYDSHTDSLKPLDEDMKKPVEDILFSAGIAKHDSVYHNQEITNLL